MLLKHNLLTKKCGVFGPKILILKNVIPISKGQEKIDVFQVKTFVLVCNFNSKGKMCKNLLIASFVGVALPITTRLRILSSMR